MNYEEFIRRLPFHSLEIKARHPVIAYELEQVAMQTKALVIENARLREEVKNLNQLLENK